MKYGVKKLVLFFGLLLSLFLVANSNAVKAGCTPGPVVSCNDSYLHKVNYIDVVVKDTSEVKLFVSPDFPVQVIVKQNGTVVRNIPIQVGTSVTAWDTRTVNGTPSSPVTLRYEFIVCFKYQGQYTSCQPYAGWMPTNTASGYQGTCGTGCVCLDGGNYAVVDAKPFYNAAVAASNGGTPYDIRQGGVSLFNDGQRSNGIDRSVTCWNDDLSDPNMKDFNDVYIMWTTKSAAPSASPSPSPSASPSPSPSPSVSPSPSASPSVTVSVTASPSVSGSPSASPSVSSSPRVTATHTIIDTGFADSFLLYTGALMYAVGIILFMGSKIFNTGKPLKLRIVL